MAYIGCLRDLKDMGEFSSLSIKKDDGKLFILSGAFSSEESKRAVYLHTYFLIKGISLISQQYPDFVRLG